MPGPYLPGDVVLTRGSSWFSRAIRRRSRGRREEPTVFNHVGMVVAGGPGVREAFVIEALIRGVKVRTLHNGYAGTKDEVAIYRPEFLSDFDRKSLAGYALRYAGDRYGFGKILLHLAGLESFATYDNGPICSWVVGKSFQKLGYGFGKDASELDPDDIGDWVTAPENQLNWTCVRHLSRVPS